MKRAYSLLDHLKNSDERYSRIYFQGVLKEVVESGDKELFEELLDAHTDFTKRFHSRKGSLDSEVESLVALAEICFWVDKGFPSDIAEYPQYAFQNTENYGRAMTWFSKHIGNEGISLSYKIWGEDQIQEYNEQLKGRIEKKKVQ